MVRRRGPRLTLAEKTELWRRWRRGESMNAIGRALGRIAALVHGCSALPRKGPLVTSPRVRPAAHNQDMKSRVHPKYKTKYHVRNWAVYERALVRRGDVTVWPVPGRHCRVGA